MISPIASFCPCRPRALTTPVCSTVLGSDFATFPLHVELTVSIKWWINALVEIPPRRTALDPPNTVLVYSDAAGSGHISFVAVFNSRRKTGHSHLPCWFTAMAGIYEFEMCSAILALHAAALFAPGLPILLCTDNAGAAAALIRGNCASELGRVLASVFRTAAALNGSLIWVGEVRSKFNVADAPSRDCPLVEERMATAGPNFGLPGAFADTFASRESLLSRQYKCHPSNPRFLNPWPFPQSDGTGSP